MKKYLLLFFLITNALMYAQKGEAVKSNGDYFDAERLSNQIATETKTQSDKYPKGFEMEPIFLKLYEKEGPYSFANPKAELLDLRDLSSKHFLNKDGNITSVLSAGEVHYLENGIWKTILNDFHPVSKSGFQYGAEHNSVKTYVGNSLQDGFEVNYPDGRKLNIMQGVYMVALDANKNEISNTRVDFQGNVSQVNGEFLKYANLSAGISAVVENNSIGYKVDYEVQSLNNLPNLTANTEYIAFVEKIHFDNNKNSYYMDNGRIVFENSKKEAVLEYMKPVIFPKIYKNVNSLRLSEEYIVKKRGNDFFVYILIKKEWLQNPNFVFPIIVDPTVTLIPNNAVAWTYTVTEAGACEQDNNMKVGFFDGSLGNDYYQCYSKYNTSSIPAANCVQTAYVNYYQHHFEDDQSNDNQLDFYFQALDPYDSDPVGTSCATDATNINNTTTWYRKYNVWGNCGGTCTDYNESNGWKNFPDNVGARVQMGLAQNFIAFSLDKINNNHSDPTFGCGWGGLGVCDNDEYLEYRGHSHQNKPTLIVTHEAPSVVATSITVSPSNTVCNGSSVTLTRVGGNAGGGATWKWYSGSCGGTLVGTGNSITVSPTSNTTYYLRAEGVCNTTACISTAISVSSASTPPTAINGTSTICEGGTTTLTLQGGVLGTGSTWQWYSGSCGGTAVGSGTSITVSPTVTTTYYLRAEGSCATTACLTKTVTVQTASTAPGSIAATLTTICAGVSTTLSVNGGSLGSTATWQWYSGSCGGTAVGTGSSITVSPTSNTTYFVRAEGSCNTTTCASVGINVDGISTAPTSITTTGDTVCLGSPTILSVNGGTLGVGATWQWYTNSCGGVTAGTGNSISVNPTVTTTYYLRGEGSCNTTACVTKTITVSQIPVAPVASNVDICESFPVTLSAAGNGGTLKWYLTNISTPEIATGNTLALGVLPAATYYRYVSETNAFGCESIRKEVEIIVKPTPSDAPVAADATVCPGASASLLAANPNTALIPASNFNWYTSAALTTVVYTGAIYNTQNLMTPPATYTFYVAGVLNGCVGAASPVVVDFYSADIPTVSNDTSVCNGDIITLNASAAGSIEIRWYANGDLSGYLHSGSSYTTPSLSSNTTYFVTAKYPNGCESQAEPVTVSLNPLALSPILTDKVYCASDDVVLNATNINGTLTWYSDAALTTVVGTGSPLNLGTLGAGTYNYFAQVNNGTCVSLVVSNTVEVQANPVAPTLTAPTICAGEQAIITVTGSTNVNWYSDAALTNLLFVGSTFTSPILSANTTYYVTNANATCESSVTSVLVTVNPKPTAPTAVNATVCKNQAATLTATGGAGTFIWYSDAALSNQVGTGASYTTPNLNANTSYFVVLNNGLCSSNAKEVNVMVNLDIVVVIDSISDVLCNGSNSGAIYTSVTGGNGVYTYAWTGGSTNQDLTNAGAGNYVLTVTDGLGCVASNNASISSPDALNVSLDELRNVSCNGALNGSIEISISGGTSAYTYVWSNGTANIATTKNLYNVAAGTYTVTVTDAHNCTETLTATVAENPVLTATITSNDILCYGGLSSATAIATGGSGTYTYLWSTFHNTVSVSGLNAGPLSVIVTDANGCSVQVYDTITGPTAPIKIELLNIKDVTCFNGADGAISTNITGGTGAYIISWTPSGSNGANITNLSAGTYTVNVTDINGCIASASYEVEDGLEIVSTMSVTNPKCFGEETGMIAVGTNGGTAPYSYSWNTSPAQSGVLAVNLPGDASYTVTITDKNGCVAENTAAVVYPTQMIINTIPTSVSCISTANGSVTVEVQNGNPPFQYELNGFLQTDSVFDNLGGGNYVVFVKDNNGCVAYASFDISTVSGMQAELQGAGNDMIYVTDNLYIARGEEVSLNVNLINDNGNPIVGYNWTPNYIDSTHTLSNPTFFPNDHLVVSIEVLEDVNGSVCSVFDTLHIHVSQEMKSFIPTAFSPNNDGANNYFEMNILGAKNLDVKIFNRWGEMVFANATQGNGPNNINDPSLLDNSNPRGAWDGKYNGEDVPTGVYAYTIEVTYFDGTKKVISGSVTIIR